MEDQVMSAYYLVFEDRKEGVEISLQRPEEHVPEDPTPAAVMAAALYIELLEKAKRLHACKLSADTDTANDRPI